MGIAHDLQKRKKGQGGPKIKNKTSKKRKGKK